jgi:hypothetical protein
MGSNRTAKRTFFSTLFIEWAQYPKEFVASHEENTEWDSICHDRQDR